MRIADVAIIACVLVMHGGAGSPRRAPPAFGQPGTPTPLVIERNEGEHRAWRPRQGDTGWGAHPGPFTLKLDPQNGGSTHLVLGTEDLPVGAKIDTHKHPGSDEVLLLQNGAARVTLGTTTRDAHAGATVFIPAGTWISVANRGQEPIHMIFIFSAPGFESFMRAESTPEGQPATPLSRAEDAVIQHTFAHAVVYQAP
jgi:mannose-6-phosphate isomerase-like protein (cupin superfamily)